MPINTYPKTQRKPGRVDLTPKDFDILIEDQGVRVRITPSMLCPNRSGLEIEEASVNHPLNCSLCNHQVIDLEELAYEDWVFIQGVGIDPKYSESARFDVKDALMTSKSNKRFYYWYKIEIIDQASQFNELVLRGKTNKDKMRYLPQDVLDGNVFIMVDSAGVKYTRGTHYVIEGQHVKWLGSTKPATGKLYSFLYPILPTYRVMELMHENRFYYTSFKKAESVPVQLPQQAHIRWDYMAKRSGSDVVAES